MEAAQITYLIGDATDPIQSTDKPTIRVIIHICNDIDRWGKGFVLALSKKWPQSKDVYHQSSKDLGSCSLFQIEEGLYICNMIAQHGISKVGGIPPIRYDALKSCLEVLAGWSRSQTIPVSFHGPRMGAGLAGGDWSQIEALLLQELSGHPIYIYDLP